MELGGGGGQETPEGFLAWFFPPDDPHALVEGLRPTLAEVARGASVELDWRWQPQEDWDRIWREGLGHRRVTPRLLVAPSWDIPRIDPGEILVTLDPGMAFGTAEHAPTRGCLRLLDTRVEEGDRIADVGAGSAILSIAAALMGAGKVLALEMDPASCRAARENLAINGVEERVRVEEALVEAGAPLPDAPYHGIVANIQRLVLLPLLPGFRASLHSGGWLILGGILSEEGEEVEAAAREAGFTLQEIDWEEEWWSGAFYLGRRSA